MRRTGCRRGKIPMQSIQAGRYGSRQRTVSGFRRFFPQLIHPVLQDLEKSVKSAPEEKSNACAVP